MSAQRKARGDAKLKTLPGERQATIAEHARAHTIAETIGWLRKDGLQTSSAALSEFLSWWSLQQQLRENESTVGQVLEDLKRAKPGMAEEELTMAGQLFFTALAIKQKDSLSWKRAQEIKIKRKALELLERRVKLLEQKAAQADQAKGVMEDKGLTAEERQQRMRQIFGM